MAAARSVLSPLTALLTLVVLSAVLVGIAAAAPPSQVQALAHALNSARKATLFRGAGVQGGRVPDGNRTRGIDVVVYVGDVSLPAAPRVGEPRGL